MHTEKEKELFGRDIITAFVNCLCLHEIHFHREIKPGFHERHKGQKSKHKHKHLHPQTYHMM